jgi:hypothetical protein
MTLLRDLGIRIATLVDNTIGWAALPPWLGLMVIFGVRSRLTARNLAHTSLGLPPSRGGAAPPACRRTVDGTFNDLAYPSMGAAGTPFGHNIPLTDVHPVRHGTGKRSTALPSERTVSNELLARTAFVPAGKLNLLAAAWTQFVVHDWFSHGPTPPANPRTDIEIPLADGDEWKRRHGSMRIPTLAPDRTHPPCAAAMPPTHLNTVTHWWDGSQIYGSDQATLDRLRRGAGPGELKMDGPPGQRVLPVDDAKPRLGYGDTDLAGFNDNWWIGLRLLHTLFALEHNAICVRLASHYRNWSDEDLFAHARLINAAVIAKIHTVEWTPALLDHRTLAVGMRAAWNGLAHEKKLVYRLLGHFAGADARKGIPQSDTELNGVPYSMTEEFVSVYRMHALLPDEFCISSLNGGGAKRFALTDLAFGNARAVTGAHGFSMEDVAHSFATQSAGAISLHNYPNTLRELKLPDGRYLDLAAVDVFRDRERGLPRYNAFRRLIGRRPVATFGEMVGRAGQKAGWDADLKRVYGDVENVDLMVGLHAEPKPPGFGISDTAFHLFIVANPRRLQCDRFFTTDFTDAIYTREGKEWIRGRTMSKVIEEHWPALKRHVDGLANPFHRWDDSSNRSAP